MSMTAQSRYDSLVVRRDPFLRRGRDCAALSIPSLLPPEGHTGTSNLPQPYQGFVARLVINLASKLMIAMYPPGIASFRLQIPPEVLLQEGKLDADSETERGLSLVERSVSAEIERRAWRSPTFTSLQHLIVTGNILEMMRPDNTIRAFRLDQYVVVRDAGDRLIEVVIKEAKNPQGLTSELQSLAGTSGEGGETVDLYTWGKLDPSTGTWHIHQELNQTRIPGSEGEWKVSPFNAIRWSGVLGEDYGRGKGEEHYGDWVATDGLSKSVLDGSAMASMNIKMVRPNAAGGLNLRRRLQRASNGDWVVGNPEDVGMLQFENVNGLQVAQMELQSLKQELAAAFLMNSGIQRDAERVTAYEIRKLAEELEGTLGGVYSMLASDMQLFRLKRLLLQMQDNAQLPDFPDGVVEPTILTGIEALGREQDVQRVATALQFLNGLPPEVIQFYVKWPELLNKAFNGLSLPDAVNSEDEAEQLRQQAALREAMSAAAQAGGQEAAAGAVNQQRGA